MSSIKEIKNNDNESSYYDVSADNNVGTDTDTILILIIIMKIIMIVIRGVFRGGLSPPMDQ